MSAPVITSISPTSGIQGTSVVITGTGFSLPGQVFVIFGSTLSLSFAIKSDTQITALSPDHAPGTVDVQVVTQAGASDSSTQSKFTYATPPVLVAISPSSAPSNEQLTIFGSNLATVTSASFGDVLVSVFGQMENSLSVIAPFSAVVGPVDFTVSGPGGVSNTLVFTYTALPPSAPTVTSVTPNTGPVTGGTPITITGTGFLAATTVYIGVGTDPVPFNIVSDTVITAFTPPYNVGWAHVIVQNANGFSNATDADLFTYTSTPILPAITSLSPNQGPQAGGIPVVITGTGFTGATSIKFGDASVAASSIDSDTQITVTLPPSHNGAGLVTVTVTTPAGTANNAQFLYIAPVPTVTLVTPNQGPVAGGAEVTINGTGFLGVVIITFGLINTSQFAVDSDTVIHALTPNQIEAGPVHVTVSNPSHTSAATEADLFTYTGPPPPPTAPTVTLVAPNEGPLVGGTQVTLTGTGFLGVTQVAFGSTVISLPNFQVLSDTSILVASPPSLALVAVNVIVTSPDGSSPTASANLFTYVSVPPPVPVVESLSPAKDCVIGGATIVITGTGLTGATDVEFGLVPASSFVVISDTRIDAVAPGQLSPLGGVVDVVVSTETDSSLPSEGSKFTYLAMPPPPLPTILSLVPSEGPVAGGTAVTITGANFVDVTSVLFGSLLATGVMVVSETQITVVSPAQVAPGQVDVTVTTVAGTSATSDASKFTYLAPPPPPLPVVVSLAPMEGPLAGGTAVTITGANLLDASMVFFGTVPALSFTIVDASHITAVSPPGLVAGPVNVTVVTLSGTSVVSAGSVFTYIAAPPPPPPCDGTVNRLCSPKVVDCVLHQMCQLWEAKARFTIRLIKKTVGHKPTEKTLHRLYDNQKQLGCNLAVIYGRTNGRKYTAILERQVDAQVALLDAILSNDADRISTTHALLDANAVEFAEFWECLNGTYVDQDTLLELMLASNAALSALMYAYVSGNLTEIDAAKDLYRASMKALCHYLSRAARRQQCNLRR